VARVGVGEEEVELTLPKLERDRVRLARELRRQLRVVVREVGELDQVAGAPLELLPRRDQFAVLKRFARAVSRRRRVVPGAWLG